MGLSWNHQDWRFFDPQLLRWHSVDPEVENGQESWSPYSFGFDNAVRYNDVDGRQPQGPGDDVPTVARGLVEFSASVANLVLSSWAYTTGSSTKLQAQVYETNTSLGINYARVPVGGLAQEAKSTALDVANVAINVMPAGRAGVGRALEQAAGKAGAAVIAQEVKGTAAAAAKSKPGPFSVSDWTGYPKGNVPKPQGPFRVVEGAEYSSARRAANRVNGATHKGNPALEGKDLHEVHPVKFGGSPVDPANKVPLTRQEHSQYTNFWNDLLRSLK